MVRTCRCLLIVLTLLAGGWPHLAAGAEKSPFDGADVLFNLEMWEPADAAFGVFIKKYPKSPRVPEAILFQAEARFKIGRFTEAIALLSTNLSRAGTNEDEYLYWIAQAETGNSNYTAAADTFARLIEKHPASDKRLPASVAQATLYAKQEDWPRVIELLQKPDGVFQQLAKSPAAVDWVAEGWLVLGEAQLARKAFNEAAVTRQSLAALNLRSDLNWRRAYFQCRLALAEGLAEDAWQASTNLVALAGSAADRAESASFQARVLEQLNRLDEAIGAYGLNLATNVPVELQRSAMLKIADLSLAQKTNTAAAIKILEDYWKQFPGAEAADAALLMLGELQLKEYVAGTLGTNGSARPAGATDLLAEAQAKFDRVLNTFSNSPLAGKALLNLGWCFWTNHRFAQSETNFHQAVQRLPVSLDQAVARFKWADAQFMQGDFGGALTNYEAVVAGYDSVPEVKDQLYELALYQATRAALTNHDLPAAESALRNLLKWFPDGSAGPRCLLLVGQGFNRQQEPAKAREIFAEFEQRHPANALLPLVRLAVARTYEQEGNWAAALDLYTDWVNTYTNHDELPQAEFSRAHCYPAGQETNALALFKSFVTRFRTHELAPQAQIWIADYYYNHGDFQNAESNYQLVVYLNTNAPLSLLAYQALMMAGRAAVRSLHYREAIDVYFINLTSNTNCPADLRDQALFAYADTLTNLETNRQANLGDAITILQKIQTNSDLWVPAQGRIGDCYLQLAATNNALYPQARDAYQLVVDTPRATFTARSQARVGQGIVAEKLADLADANNGEDRSALLQQALKHYLGVFVYASNLRDDEHPDQFWVKEAGLKAESVAEKLQLWQQSYNIYQQLQDWFPTLNLEPKIRNLLKAHPELVQPK